MKKIIFYGFLCILFSSCRSSDDVSMKDKLESQNQKLQQVVKTKNIDLLDEVYDAEAYYMAPGDTLVHGVKAIKSKWQWTVCHGRHALRNAGNYWNR